MHPLRSFKIIVFLIVGAVASGCHTSRVIQPTHINLAADFCVPYKNIPVGDQVIYSNTDSLIAHESDLKRYLSKRDILIANASGSLDLLHKLSNLLEDPSAGNKAYLEYTTAVEKNITLVRTEVDDISTELECETIRCRQLSSYLAGLNSKRNANLTVAAIIAGAVTTVTPIFIKQTTPQNIVLISGGVLTAGLGLLTLNPRGKAIQLLTPNNMLTDIWYGDKTSLVYPPSIWHILNTPGFSNLEMDSKRMLIRMRWLQFELGSEPDKKTEELLFGSGGIFDQATLDIRATMLSEVESHINSIRKDLDSFTFSFDDLKMKVIQKLDL
jgi:hypothetical protein